MSIRRPGAGAGELCPAGAHRLPEGWFPSRGCRACVIESALDSATVAVMAALPGLADDVARVALTAVTANETSYMDAARYRRIAVYLNASPDSLTSGASTIPVDVARLIGQLRRLGRDEVTDPCCADCGRACFPRAHRPDGLRVCRICDGRRRSTACARCGTVTRICARAEDGSPLCGVCRRADPASWETCGLCGEPASIRMTLLGRRIGACCYLKPHERCSVCGVGRAVSPYASGKATCAGCATGPLVPCHRCGLDAPTTAAGETPLCLRCCGGTNQPCRVCARLTVSRDHGGRPQCATCVSRPRRACGGCGRESVIALRAGEDNPDLCSSCWNGPTTPCARCGRLRACRGQRNGLMLCRGCTPRPKRTCAYCGHTRTVSAMWAAGPACASCYRGFMRAKDTCPGCGQHRRLLPYVDQPEPMCAPCAGAPPGPVCGRCGNEDWLYHKDRCARCVLDARLTVLLGDTDNRDRLGLQPLFGTLTDAQRPEAIIDWIRPTASGTAHSLLTALGRGEVMLSHETLDALNTPGNGGTANHLDAILTAIGALPPRDLELARLERAVAAILAGVTDDDQRKLLRAYATWHLLRRARKDATQQPLRPASRHSRTSRLAAAAHLLSWLSARDLTLAGCGQSELDAYLIEHHNRGGDLAGFLAWARRTHRAARLTLPARPKTLPRTGSADDDGRWRLARALLHDDGYRPADRVAGLLVLLFGQRSHRISRLRTDDITIDGDRVTIALGASPVELPPPFAGHVVALLAARRPRTAKRVTDPGRWLFPSHHPDRPALPETITHRLQRIGVQPTAHRASALLHLAAEMPPALVSDLLGLGRTAAQAWSTLAARPWAAYVADRLTDQP